MNAIQAIIKFILYRTVIFYQLPSYNAEAGVWEFEISDGCVNLSVNLDSFIWLFHSRWDITDQATVIKNCTKMNNAKKLIQNTKFGYRF